MDWCSAEVAEEDYDEDEAADVGGTASKAMSRLELDEALSTLGMLAVSCTVQDEDDGAASGSKSAMRRIARAAERASRFEEQRRVPVDSH